MILPDFVARKYLGQKHFAQKKLRMLDIGAALWPAKAFSN